MLKRPSIALLGFLCLVLSCGAVFGQELTGTLKGTVTDQDGLALPGATVTIQSPQLLGGPRTVQTDENGKYRFQALDPGTYNITVEMESFQTQTRQQQLIHVGKVTSISFTLGLATVDVEMVVTGETPVVDKEQSGVQHNITQQLLEDIPMTRSYQSVIHMLPGIKGGSNPNVHGESQYNNQYLIDGVDTTDPVTGTFGTNFTFDAVQDIQYSTAGYLPEYGQVLGAVTNIVTKSGGNKIGGSVNFNTFQPSFTSSHGEEIKQAVVDDSTEYEISTTIGGPIKKDKIWYYGVFRWYDRATTKEVVPYDETVTVWYWLGKLSSQFNQNNRVVFQAFGDPFDMNNENMGTAWAEEANPSRKQGGGKVSGNWAWVLSPNSFLETRAYYNQQVLDLEAKNGDLAGIWDHERLLDNPTTQQPYNLQNWGSQGSTGWASTKNLNKRPRMQFEADYSHLLEGMGEHELKAGMELEYSQYKQITGGDWSQQSTTWTQGGTLLGWIRRWYPNATQDDWDGTRNYSLISHPESEEKSSRNRASFFIQDKWNPSENITINYGVRVDDTTAENDVGTDILSFTTVSPRAGVTYDMFKDGRTVIRGSVGRYYENGTLRFPSAFNETSEPTYRYMYNWFTGDFDLLRSITGGPSGFILLEGEELKSPYMNEFTVGFEREIFPDFSVGFDYITRRTKDILEDIEVNLIWQEFEDNVTWHNGANDIHDTPPNWGIVGFNDGTPQVVFALTNPDNARRQYDGFEITFNKRFSNKWQLFGSYTWSEAKGPVDTTFTIFGDGPPYDYNKEDGFLSHDRTHDIVVSG
ncbi:TonB-dependent receptor domain-containing protein, partial [Acidobacteriota bacterium]